MSGTDLAGVTSAIYLYFELLSFCFPNPPGQVTAARADAAADDEVFETHLSLFSYFLFCFFFPCSSVPAAALSTNVAPPDLRCGR